mmetsp:Transcript_29943/g.81150  ORF Transcript_29943/g.81150 Transcript_29943/m.81150 type:complete len:238 (-) Transcript_29943:528-1241(-)
MMFSNARSRARYDFCSQHGVLGASTRQDLMSNSRPLSSGALYWDWAVCSSGCTCSPSCCFSLSLSSDRSKFESLAAELINTMPATIVSTLIQYKTYCHQGACAISDITMQPERHAAVMCAPSKIVTMKTPLYSARPCLMNTKPPKDPKAARPMSRYGVGLCQAAAFPVVIHSRTIMMKPFTKNTLPMRMPAMTPKAMPRTVLLRTLACMHKVMTTIPTISTKRYTTVASLVSCASSW